MKYSLEEIKNMLEGITPREWEYGSDSELVYTGCDGAGLVIGRARELVDRKFIAAAPTIIRDLLAELDSLRADRQLEKDIDLYPGTLALKREVERLKNLLEDVVNELDLPESAIEKHGPLGTHPSELVRLVLNENNRRVQIAESLAATHLADQELLVARERRRVAQECAEMCEPWGVADRIRTRYGVEE